MIKDTSPSQIGVLFTFSLSLLSVKATPFLKMLRNYCTCLSLRRATTVPNARHKGRIVDWRGRYGKVKDNATEKIYFLHVRGLVTQFPGPVDLKLRTAVEFDVVADPFGGSQGTASKYVGFRAENVTLSGGAPIPNATAEQMAQWADSRRHLDAQLCAKQENAGSTHMRGVPRHRAGGAPCTPVDSAFEGILEEVDLSTDVGK